MNELKLLLSVSTVALLPMSAFTTEEGGASKTLPSFWSLLVGHEGPLHHYVDIVYGLATSVFFAIVVSIVYRNRRIIPGKLQNFLEMVVEGLFNFIESVLGNNAKKYTPFLGTLFVYILVNNLWGLIPGGHSPMTNLSVTASLAIMVFLYSQYTGLTRLGVIKYFDHLLGQPRDLLGWSLVPLLLPIHIITEISRPFTLAIRLFGNIMGEDIVVAAFVSLGLTMLSFIHSPVGFPLNVPFIFLCMLLSTIQALVFTLLSTVYI